MIFLYWLFTIGLLGCCQYFANITSAVMSILVPASLCLRKYFLG